MSRGIVASMKTILTLLLALVTSLPTPAGFEVKVSGHGRAMILIPGLSAGGGTWDTTVDHFKDRYECHVLTVAGFAGVPRVPAPMLDRIVDDLAAYIREHHLDKPIVVGHSLGGFLALRLAIKYPDLPGRIVDVDGYANYLSLMGTPSTPEQAKATADMIRQNMGHMPKEAYEAYVKTGMATRPMVSRDADFEVLVKWGLASDGTAVADALAEMFEADLRPDLAKITAPTLVLAAWQSYGQFTDHDKHLKALHDQFDTLPGVRLELNDTARHFIMWDDPQWMFGLMDKFLEGK
jgi:pimeloyl-ACP methyl ester carboxylesterase